MNDITFQHPDITDIKDMIRKSAENYGDKVAYCIRNGEAYINYTYKDIYEIVNALGTSLCNMGLKGKKIAIIGKNCFHWEIAYLAIVCGVGIVVPLDKTLPENELEGIIERSDISAIFYSEPFKDTLMKIKFGRKNSLRHLISMDAPEHKGGIYSQNELIEYGRHLIDVGFDDYISAKINPYEMNIMLFTSGTTSKSKVVALSQNNLCANLIDIKSVLDISIDDVFLSYLPLHHVFECTVGFLFPLYRGAKITFADSTRKIVKNLHEYNVTFFACVPAVYEKIFAHIRRILEKAGMLDEILALEEQNQHTSMEERKKAFSYIHEMLGNKIRYFLSGAAPLDPDIERRYRVLGLNLLQAYGLTETAPVLTMNTIENHRLGSVGRALPNVELKIADPDENGIGELVAKGSNIMLGYYGDSESTSDVLENGWFHTGDLARIDKDGYVFICGRKKSVIVLKNGKNVFPEEMEQILNKIEGVKESLVYGRQHGSDKDDIHICCKIVYDPDLVKKVYKLETEEQITAAFWNEIKAINRTMPAYKAIRKIIITKEPLPKTSTNKIKR